MKPIRPTMINTILLGGFITSIIIIIINTSSDVI